MLSSHQESSHDLLFELQEFRESGTDFTRSLSSSLPTPSSLQMRKLKCRSKRDLVEGGEIKGSGLPLAFQIFTAPRCPFISQERTSTGPACWTCGLGDLMLQLNWEVLRLNALLSDLRKISLLYGD